MSSSTTKRHHQQNVNNNNNNNGGSGPHQQQHAAASATATAVRVKPRRSVTPTSRSNHTNHDNEPGRVRVAVRLRPRNTEDLLSDADFADSVELQPELKRLKLKKNNWNTEAYRFDEVFTETASQRRVYEVVAKPVVESVLDGYNGTIMAYGQTGTGKTYTMGNLGKDDASQCGIMVRALEDIITSITPASDSIEISYLQLYMETVQDLLAPEKINIHINEDARTGEVSVPGATVVRIQDVEHFLQLLKVGEANRHAANTKLNTESSRSHAILMVYVRRSANRKTEDEITSQEKDINSRSPHAEGVPIVRKSKLLIVDLAGSERVNKSGSEGQSLEEAKFINLSLTSLGKCINALAENSPHIPTRDSKLTRLLRDSFGGTARTSLIITIGPSARYHAETTSTIMFGQRAMKIVNVVKLKEEFDYESLCRKLESQIDHLSADIDRQLKLRNDDHNELEKTIVECQETKRNLVARSEFLEKENSHLEMEIKDSIIKLKLEKENNSFLRDKVAQLETNLDHIKQNQQESSAFQKVLADTTHMYEKKIAELTKTLDDERTRSENAEEQLDMMYEKKIAELAKKLDDECTRSEKAEKQLDMMEKLLHNHQKSIQQHDAEKSTYQAALADTTQMYEKKILELTEQLEEQLVYVESVEEHLELAKKLRNDQQNLLQVQMQNEIDRLSVKLQEMNRLHETITNELQFLKTENKELVCDKDKIDRLTVKLQEMNQLQETTTNELQFLKMQNKDLICEKATLREELHIVKQKLSLEEKQRKAVEHELLQLKISVQENENDFVEKKSYMKENIGRGSSGYGISMSLTKSNPLKESFSSGQRATIAKICEEVGLEKILQLLSSDDQDVQVHALKVVANLAAEDVNQAKIVEEGGLDALLLMLVRSSQNTTILRVASGAIANLAMNEMNQSLIMSKGGAQLLAKTASKTDDPQTLRMVAGALANLCGNEKLHTSLKEDGAIRALLGMVRTGNVDVISQVARGIANFAKCESRGNVQGYRKGRSLLIDDGVLDWLIGNSNATSASTRRHMELALCHLAQNEENVTDFLSKGGVKELTRISTESSREDIRHLAKKTLKLSHIHQTEMC
ncbi:hypothetical protein ACFE04_003356 [Oxalis oulophora]